MSQYPGKSEEDELQYFFSVPALSPDVGANYSLKELKNNGEGCS